jgi:hypothetical protein
MARPLQRRRLRCREDVAVLMLLLAFDTGRGLVGAQILVSTGPRAGRPGSGAGLLLPSSR